MGCHHQLPKYSDPIVIFPIEAVEYEYEMWRYQKASDNDLDIDNDLEISLSPDYFHKDNISGGAPYKIKLPNYAIDAVLENERNETTFVNYLRLCFQYSGFPGIKWQKDFMPFELLSTRGKLLKI
jgi:hypothetical protein